MDLRAGIFDDVLEARAKQIEASEFAREKLENIDAQLDAADREIRRQAPGDERYDLIRQLDKRLGEPISELKLACETYEIWGYAFAWRSKQFSDRFQPDELTAAERERWDQVPAAAEGLPELQARLEVLGDKLKGISELGSSLWQLEMWVESAQRYMASLADPPDPASGRSPLS